MTIDVGLATGQPRSVRTTLASITRASDGRTFRLVHKTAGLQLAGAGLTPVSDGWGVLFEMDHATHGQWFATETEARERFALWGSK